MARDDEILSLYRISGIRGIGLARVFPEPRAVKKARKSKRTEKELPEIAKGKQGHGEGVDIEV